MKTEIEARFAGVDPAVLRGRLRAAGFSCAKESVLMRRAVFDLPGREKNAWARVRDEGDRITVSFKRTDNASLTGTREAEMTAQDFGLACAVLEACGLIRKSRQETRRETWRRGGTEATIDLWPALPPFCEIEAETESAVKQAAADLGFEWHDALFGPVSALYALAGIPEEVINAFPLLTFENENAVRALAG